MADEIPEATLETVHQDLRAGFAGVREEFAGVRAEFAGVRADFAAVREEIAGLRTEMRAGFADLKTTLVVGFASLPTRESAEEMLRIPREGHGLNEGRFTELDARIRDQQLENQHALHALTRSHQALADEQCALSAEVRSFSGSADRLIRRIEALIRGRQNGEETA